MPNRLAKTQNPLKWSALPLVPVLAFLVLAPNVEWSADISYYDQKRLAQLLALVALPVLLLFVPCVRARAALLFSLQPAWVNATLIVIGALGIVSALRAEVPMYALAEVGLAVSLAGALLVCAAAMERDWNRPLLLALVACSGVYVARFVAGYISAQVFGAAIFLPELYSNFSHIRFFSQLQSWTLPLIVLPALLLPWPRARWALYVLAAAWWALHFGTGTRGTSVGLLVALVAVPVLLPRAGPGWAARQLGLAAAGAMIYWAAIGSQETWGDFVGASRVMSGGGSGRFEMMAASFDMIKAAPLLGGGPQHYANNPEHFSAHPHNSLAQMAAEWGLPATLLLLLVLSFAFFHWVRYARGHLSATRGRGLTHAALTGSAITAAVHSLVSGVSIMPLSQMCLVFVVAWMLAEYRREAIAVGVVRTRDHVLVLALMFFGMSLWLPVAVRDGPGRAEITEEYRAVTGKLLRPRFWHQGFLFEDAALAPDSERQESPQEGQ